MTFSPDKLFQGAVPDASEAVLVTDALGAVRFCTPCAADYFGVGADELMGQPVRSLMPGLPLKSSTTGYNLAFLNFWFTPGRFRPLQALRRNGGAFALMVSFAQLQINDKRYAVFGLNRPAVDDSALARLREEQETAELSEEAVIITDLDGVTCYVNPAFEALTGYRRDEVTGQTPAILVSGDHSAQFYDRLWAKLHAGTEFHGVLVNRKRNGETFQQVTSILPLWDAQGVINHFIVTGSPINEARGLEFDAAHQPVCDSLTRLPDSNVFMDRLHQAIARAARYNQGLSVCYVELEGFAEINDVHGSIAGDAVLRIVALRLVQCMRGEDTVARIGTSRFAILNVNIARREQAAFVIDKISRALRSAVWVGELRIPVTAHIVVCLYPDDGANAQALLGRADAVLEQARAGFGAGQRRDGETWRGNYSRI